MAIDLGIVMDPIAGISIKKDTSFAMLLAAQRRGWRLWYLEVGDLFLHQGLAQARVRRLAVQDDPVHWYETRRALTWVLTFIVHLLGPLGPQYFTPAQLPAPRFPLCFPGTVGRMHPSGGLYL